MSFAALLLCLLAAGTAIGDAPPDDGEAFEPTPVSQPLYGTHSPAEDPAVQRTYVEAHDGVDLFVETWLPAPSDGHVPPDEVATILVMTPYANQGEEAYDFWEPDLVDHFTARGFAVAQHHVRGSGESGGCMEQTGSNQIDDAARVIEYLGKEAPWSNGKVGSYGISYDAETQTSVAALGDPTRTRYLEAIVPLAAVGGMYDWVHMDGVPWAIELAQGWNSYAASSLAPGNTFPQHFPGHSVERTSCSADGLLSWLNPVGNYGPFWEEREYRRGAAEVDVPTLYVHGLRDFGVQPIATAGWFSELPSSMPHKGLFPVMGHAFPGNHSAVEPDWERADWPEMVTAWYDRYLKGIDTGVGDWPDVQIQDALGQWRQQDEFPYSDGPAGHLALGPAGRLGAEEPTGSTFYVEQLHTGPSLPGQRAVFETPPLEDELHVTGMPVVDLWVVLDRPDAHVTAQLEIVGPDGDVRRHEEGSRVPLVEAPLATFGMRSAQHLDPLERGWFEQEEPKEPPIGEPVNVKVRLQPTDLVVAADERLRLTVSGALTYDTHLGLSRSVPSGAATSVTVLHDCEHPSVLRFLMPSPTDELLNVRERGEHGPLASEPAQIGPRDADGLAGQPVCGEDPARSGLLDDGKRS